MDAHPPVPVQELANLRHDGPTPAEKWIIDARRRDLIMPTVSAAIMVAVALAVPLVLLALAIAQRVTS